MSPREPLRVSSALRSAAGAGAADTDFLAMGCGGPAETTVAKTVAAVFCGVSMAFVSSGWSSNGASSRPDAEALSSAARVAASFLASHASAAVLSARNTASTSWKVVMATRWSRSFAAAQKGRTSRCCGLNSGTSTWCCGPTGTLFFGPGGLSLRQGMRVSMLRRALLLLRPIRRDKARGWHRPVCRSGRQHPMNPHRPTICSARGGLRLVA
mmetsp:Transcript_27861/g.87432  ORF Transcript_27861/g.87432 Transcript_27861/m.87432 type:complete len:212 (-) Transcript_27861:44-679(-)